MLKASPNKLNVRTRSKTRSKTYSKIRNKLYCARKHKIRKIHKSMRYKEYIVIPSTLFDYIKNIYDISYFVSLNRRSIRVLRCNLRRTSEQSAEAKKKFSETMSKARKKYIKNSTPEQKKAFAERMRRGQKRYWATVSKKAKKKHLAAAAEASRKSILARWKNKCPGLYKKKDSRIINKVEKIEKDIPRINTYSGVLTEEQLTELD